ncbi:MAG TPA: acyltransferase, partial [Acidimicrobiales bacterium]|nr:acyltransferase [Acidimicrobiales bacterium]
MQSAFPLHRRRYVSSFDGLRAVLVAGVLLYHLTGAQLFTATGEVAVIAFFALSGFLITFLLLDEQRARGRIDLRAFFRRRAVRLVPALVLLLGVWAVVALAFRRAPWITAVPGGGPGGPMAVSTVAETVGAALAYVTNWLDAFVQYNLWTGYSPLGHLWSLAVEEQFYLVWGPAMMLLCRVRRGGWWITALALAALAEPVLLYGEGTNRVYFGTDTRMSALLVGAALGWWWRSGRLARLERSAATPWIGLVSVAGLVVAGMGFRHPTVAWQWTGGIVLASLASGGIVTYLANRSTVGGVPGLLGRPAMVWLGQRSYAVYLWGYVFNTWFRSLGPLAAPLVVACTLVTAEASYRLVEQPLRARGRRVRAPARPRPVVAPAPVEVLPVATPAPEL